MKHASEALAVVAVCGLLAFWLWNDSHPVMVAVGLDCQGETVRVYGADDAPEASKVCRTVEIHKVP
ncbi:hypothetical protein HOU00_gp106 [Caulobacter phage CcrPW]|uniref:Uncharacterized protein n=1 Tax=Caulobacter phage CcrPW TaxID=2283271 RepID=A0A385EE92_9CAUD|nr:hypothetical protein HOU00_gp031 [Caulobacter phage CcrPW]YP_009809649.1 hypothetical protein HOU00_gp106 [Caulobacter phage CcrPW]AXQ68570.1 hypothetical protein CcrPW_gp031 [Caulobacter phage CcrPW]AXQ69019.1 hypothetical protein CcrPW_gp480 [Caulobacter phage CcrPW]